MVFPRANELKEIRETKNLTFQALLADQINVCPQSITRAEKGTSISAKTFALLMIWMRKNTTY
jgi:DNA-binding XRE family transcriptional regulator